MERTQPFKIICFALVAIVLSTGATTDAAPVKIACVGASDVSTPTGYGTPNYPVYLAQMLGYGYLVGNFGASGTTMIKKGNAPYWNTQQYVDCGTWLPDIVVIMLGSNDSKPYNWVYKDDYVPDYNSMIDHYRSVSSHPTIYLNTLLTAYGAGNFDITDSIVTGKIVPLIKQIGIAKECPVFDVNAATKNMPQNFPDNIHPNSAGAQVVAKTVFDGLMRAGEKPPIVNAALNRPVTVSSAADNTSGANAVDSDFTTRWSSAYGDHEWMYVDLGSVKTVTAVYLNWEAAYGKAYKIQVAEDTTNWNTVYSTTSGKGGVEEIDLAARGRYVKLLGVQRATTYGYSLWDFAVNAGPATRSGQAVRAGASAPILNVSLAATGSRLTFSYDLQHAATVTTTLCDMAGRIAVTSRSIEPAGRHAVEHDCHGLGAGVYLCKIEAGGLAWTARVFIGK